MHRTYRYLSEFTVGEKFTTLSRTVTETDIVLFAGISGDQNPVHTDQTYAEKLPFKNRIAHGLLGAGIATGLWGRMGMVDGSAIAALDTYWKFVGAIPIGSTIHCDITVAAITRSTKKPDRGVLKLDYEIVDQDGKLCQTGYMNTLLKWEAPSEEG